MDSADAGEPPPGTPEAAGVADEPPPPPLPPDALPASGRASSPPGNGRPQPPQPAAGDDARRSRPRTGLLLMAALVVIALPAALMLAVLSGSGSDDEATTSATDEVPAPPGAGEPTAPDLDGLTGGDAALARLLMHVDESERAMIAFQQQLGAVRGQAGAAEPEELVAEVRRVAEEGGAELAEARTDLVEPVDDGRFEQVRQAYLSHHDVWADYLDALVEDPTVLGGEAEGAHWQLLINTSAAAFSRELREVLEGEVASPVRAYADDILRRGFEQPELVPDA